MKKLNTKFEILVFIVLSFSFFHFITPVLADEQVVYPDVCSPQNPDCYFERYGKLKLLRIEPIQASIIIIVSIDDLSVKRLTAFQRLLIASKQL